MGLALVLVKPFMVLSLWIVLFDEKVSPSIVAVVEYYKYGVDKDRLCGLVVRVPGYRSRGPGLDSRRYQIF
jgi:hypothetical protein